MRAWTLGVSIVVHLCFIAGVIVAPLFATDELPTPPRASEYVLVSARLPDPPAPLRPPSPRTPSPDAAPLTPQDSILPETPRPVEPIGPMDFDVAGDPNGGGVVPGSMVVGDPLPPPPRPEPPAPRQAHRVGGDIRPPRKVQDVTPRYPPIAREAGVEGLVILEATISEDGAVQNVRVLRGQPLLDQAAVDAVRQWRFTPTLLNGQPVPVVMTVTVSFTLNRP
jgi:protein TonB